MHWYGLGPVSVLPEYQRKGIAKALIQEACLVGLIVGRAFDLEAEKDSLAALVHTNDRRQAPLW